VRDMWLAGFDAPVLHTLYIDKPMHDQNLMQAIARVNRVFGDKPGGLVVDYIGIADDLKQALSRYSERDRDDTLIPMDVAVNLAREKHDVVAAFFHGLAYREWRGRPRTEQVRLLRQGGDRVCVDDETRSRFLGECGALSKAFALINARPEADALRSDVAFFADVRRNVAKYTLAGAQPSSDVEVAVKQLVSESVAAGEVIDIFAVAGAGRPDMSVLSDAFLEEVRDLGQPNLQFEVLRKLLGDEIASRMRRNVATYRSFKERLEESIRAYLSHSVQSAEVISALVQMALELRGVEQRAASLGLSDEEVAFYDVLARGGTEAVAVSDTMRALVRELVTTIRGNLGIDWTDHDNMRARVRAAVKRLLRRSGVTAAALEDLLPTIMEQAHSLYHDWPMAA